MGKIHNRDLLYVMFFIALISGFLITGNYYIEEMRADYNAKIFSLQERTQYLENSLRETKNQLQVLTTRLSEMGESIVEIDKQYEIQFGELNQKIGDLRVESESFSPVISEVIDATVSVLTNYGQGSGAIISPEGHVVTNYHVIQGATRAGVMTYDGKVYSIKLIGYDAENDVAVLQIISNETFDYMEFGNSDLLKAGQKVVALGNPAGLSFTATEGIISSPARLANDGKYYIQTDVTINPGNSGGPLINSLGKIIGIVNFKVAGYEGLGFAIPSNRVSQVVDKIIG